MGYKWLRMPEIISLIREEMDAGIKSLDPLAIRVIGKLLLSNLTTPHTRLQVSVR
jgi:hypothetical protein